MKIYDISVPVSENTPVWPGDRQPEFPRVSRIQNGESVNLTEIHSSVHIGTHVDAPRHITDGGLTIDQIPLQKLSGLCRVVELNQTREIDRHILSHFSWVGVEKVLLKTRNSEFWQNPQHIFQADFAALTPDGAEFLLKTGVHLVGIDYLSIDLYENSDLPVHHLLLENNVVIVEGLNLADIRPGDYEFFCFPVKINGSDGAPARAVLRDLPG